MPDRPEPPTAPIEPPSPSHAVPGPAAPVDGAPDGVPPAEAISGDPEGAGAPDGESGAGADDGAEGAPPRDESGPPGTVASEVGGARRTRGAEPKVTPPPLDRLAGAIEALLLASGESLSADRIRDLLGLPSSLHVREALDGIRARWRGAELPVELQDVAGGHRVVTRPEYAEYVRRLWRRPSGDRLTQTLLETLSIVAYRQPVARAEIERIRGVQCGESLRGLLERRLIKVAGRSDQPGRPLLYATTARFLEVFGLAGLEDLPNAKELTRL